MTPTGTSSGTPPGRSRATRTASAWRSQGTESTSRGTRCPSGRDRMTPSWSSTTPTGTSCGTQPGEEQAPIMAGRWSPGATGSTLRGTRIPSGRDTPILSSPSMIPTGTRCGTPPGEEDGNLSTSSGQPYRVTESTLWERRIPSGREDTMPSSSSTTPTAINSGTPHGEEITTNLASEWQRREATSTSRVRQTPSGRGFRDGPTPSWSSIRCPQLRLLS